LNYIFKILIFSLLFLEPFDIKSWMLVVLVAVQVRKDQETFFKVPYLAMLHHKITNDLMFFKFICKIIVPDPYYWITDPELGSESCFGCVLMDYGSRTGIRILIFTSVVVFLLTKVHLPVH
jgi:hypothetical protein